MNLYVTPILICNFTDCASPLLVPLWGNKVYASVGLNSVRLAWNFDTDGLTIKEVELKYVRTKNSDISLWLDNSPASNFKSTQQVATQTGSFLPVR